MEIPNHTPGEEDCETAGAVPHNAVVAFRYRPEVLETLLRHGLAPRPDTSPEFAREALSGLYRHEIRRLRDRMLRKEFPKRDYAGRVDLLRRRYVLLKLPVTLWTLEPDDGRDSAA